MSIPAKATPTDAPIVAILTDRWSPVHFADTPLTDDEVSALFEAARWAPSSYNEQPWIYVYAQSNDGDERIKMESLLAEGNAWAKKAGLLIVSCTKKTFNRNDKPNHHAMHDLGAATIQMILEATNRGLISHQMAGFDMTKAKAILGVPEGYEPGSMIAIGHAGDPKTMTPEMQERESGPRQRKKVSEFVFHKSVKK